MSPVNSPSEQQGPTSQLCDWINTLTLEDIPEEVQTRAKYLILDGMTCALVGAHLPSSKKAVNCVLGMEGPGDCTIIGWEAKSGPLAAALLNSTFIQGFEIDDYHSEAPVHSNSILLPALFAAVQSQQLLKQVDGRNFLLATIVGYEVGPRVGRGLYGAHMLTRGWHSGPVFGHAAAAAAVSKLLGLPSASTEDALGMACTQACGLMSAQYESDVKRMQHGFAARNGLFAALLAKSGFLGIKKIFERPYGGFLACFGQGSGKIPEYRVDEITKGLGNVWQIDGIRVKPYAAMAGTHPTVDCVANLQKKYPEKMKDTKSIERIVIEMSEVLHKHGGWEFTLPVSAIAGQMNNAYVAAVQLLDSAVTPAEFRDEVLEDPARIELVRKTKCVQNDDLQMFSQRMTITFNDAERTRLVEQVMSTKGVDPALTNEEILAKWKQMTTEVIDVERRDKIEELVLGLKELDDINSLIAMLWDLTRNPLAST